MPSTLYPDGLSNKLRLVGSTHTTVSAADAVATGLSTIVSAVVSYKTDPADVNLYCSCTWSGGTLTIKQWRTADGADPTPAAATAFSKIISWLALGY